MSVSNRVARGTANCVFFYGDDCLYYIGTITYSDARFNPKTNLANVHWIHTKLYYTWFELTAMTSYIGIWNARLKQCGIS